jgi:hypothetical protein
MNIPCNRNALAGKVKGKLRRCVRLLAPYPDFDQHATKYADESLCLQVYRRVVSSFAATVTHGTTDTDGGHSGSSASSSGTAAGAGAAIAQSSSSGGGSIDARAVGGSSNSSSGGGGGGGSGGGSGSGVRLGELMALFDMPVTQVSDG